MRAAHDAATEPSASFVLSSMRDQAPGPCADFSGAIGLLDWNAYAEAVAKLQRSVPAALDPDSFTLLLVQQEAHENSGAEIIGYVADTVLNPRHRAMMKRHAADESRHSKIFLALRRLVTPDTSADLAKGEPDPFIAQYQGDFAGFLWDTHFAEISSIFYLDTVRRAVMHPQQAIRRKIDAALARVISDERRHVASTASILSELFRDDPLMVARMQASFSDYVHAIREKAERRTLEH
jgi:rubrerythrin